MSKLVRLKPYNKKRGHVLRRFMYKQTRYDVGKGWYKVPDSIAAFLETVHQRQYDEDSPLAFDVMSQEDALALEAAEKKAAEDKKAAADAPRVVEDANDSAMTTADLAGEKEEKPKRRFRRKPKDE